MKRDREGGRRRLRRKEMKGWVYGGVSEVWERQVKETGVGR